MKTYKVGLIRVLTTEDEELLQLHGKLIESYFPMFQVVSRCIPEQPEGIHDDETFAVGVPKVVNLAVELWKEGCQAIIISCAGDPGVPEARQYCSVESVFWQSSGCVGDYRRCTVRISADIR